MELSIGQITRVLQTYRGQESIAECKREQEVQTIQDQGDRVTLSPEAKALAAQPSTLAEPPADMIGPPPPEPAPTPGA